MTLPTSRSFAEEVKQDRLKALTIVTMFFSTVLLLGVLTFGTMFSATLDFMWLLAFSVLIGGAFLSREVLSRSAFEHAAWLFMLTTMSGIALILYRGTPSVQQIVPFTFPIVIFIGGLLLSPKNTFLLTLIAILIVVFVPGLGTTARLGLGDTTGAQLFSVLFTVFSAGLAAQVTGELYQITKWALDNYKKERSTNDELFNKRRELQMSLKRAEALGEKLKDTNRALEVAHQEAEDAKHFRGQFLANMSHELRTPLNAIIGFSETMLQFPIMYDNQELPPAYERDLTQIYNSGRQLLHVINDILDLAKVDAGKLEIHMQAVETGAIVNAVMATAKGLLGAKPVKLLKDVPEEMPIAWADETRLRQVLLNLYSNACKYTDEGHIMLYVTVDENNEYINFAVEDTGLGIDPEFHDKLFEEFQQAKTSGRDPRSGSGLGLAISKQLLDLMGGAIEMESTPGEGSTFYFRIRVYNGQDQMHRPVTLNQVPAAQTVVQEAERVE